MPARAVAVPFLIEFEVRVMSRVIKSSASQAVKPGPSPRFVPPQLSPPVDKPPSGRQWLHEIKLDGFRMAARIDNGRAQLFTGARRHQSVRDAPLPSRWPQWRPNSPRRWGWQRAQV